MPSGRLDLAGFTLKYQISISSRGGGGVIYKYILNKASRKAFECLLHYLYLEANAVHSLPFVYASKARICYPFSAGM